MRPFRASNTEGDCTTSNDVMCGIDSGRSKLRRIAGRSVATGALVNAVVSAVELMMTAFARRCVMICVRPPVGAVFSFYASGFPRYQSP